MCGGLALAGHRLPIKPPCHSPLHQQDRGRKYNEKLTGGRDEDREVTYLLLSQAKQTQFEETKLLPFNCNRATEQNS